MTNSGNENSVKENKLCDTPEQLSENSHYYGYMASVLVGVNILEAYTTEWKLLGLDYRPSELTLNSPLGLMVYKISYNEKGESVKSYQVTSCPVEVLAEIQIRLRDKQFRVEFNKRTIEGSIFEILKRLEQEAVVLRKSKLQSALTAMINYKRSRDLLPLEVRYPAPGCYIERGRLKTVIHKASPLTEVGMSQKNHIQKQWGGGTREAVQAYRDLVDWFDPEEILPAMGISALSPIFYEIKKRDRMDYIPYILLFGEPGIGKSTINSAFSTILWGTEEYSADSFGSKFRCDEILASTTFAVHASEVEQLSFNEYSPKIKCATENSELGFRGIGTSAIRHYPSCAYLMMDSNFQPITEPSLLPRIVRIRMNSSRLDERRDGKKRIRFKKEVEQRLGCIGQDLISVISSTLHKKGKDPIDVLLNRTRAFEEKVAGRSVVFSDARRVFFWSLVWEGIKIWNRMFKLYGVPAITLTFNDFIDEVVQPIENDNMNKVEMGPVPQFLEWLDKFLFSQPVDHKGDTVTYPGENETWRRDSNRKGFWITNALFRTYQERAVKDRTLPRFKSHRELGKAIARYHGGVLGDYYCTERFNNKPKKAVFIPWEDGAIV